MSVIRLLHRQDPQNIENFYVTGTSFQLRKINRDILDSKGQYRITITDITNGNKYVRYTETTTIVNDLVTLTLDSSLELPFHRKFDLEFDVINSNDEINGATTLNELTDVNIPAPTDGQILRFNAGTSEWVATDIIVDTSDKVTKNGDLDGANLVVGTKDNFPFQIITNNKVAVLVGTDGSIQHDIDAVSYEGLINTIGDKAITNKLYVDNTVSNAVTDKVTKGGDTDGAQLDIGTNDNFPVTIKTNNDSKMAIQEDGAIVQMIDPVVYEGLINTVGEPALTNKLYVDNTVNGIKPKAPPQVVNLQPQYPQSLGLQNLCIERRLVRDTTYQPTSDWQQQPNAVMGGDKPAGVKLLSPYTTGSNQNHMVAVYKAGESGRRIFIEYDTPNNEAVFYRCTTNQNNGEVFTLFGNTFTRILRFFYAWNDTTNEGEQPLKPDDLQINARFWDLDAGEFLTFSTDYLQSYQGSAAVTFTGSNGNITFSSSVTGTDLHGVYVFLSLVQNEIRHVWSGTGLIYEFNNATGWTGATYPLKWKVENLNTLTSQIQHTTSNQVDITFKQLNGTSSPPTTTVFTQEQIDNGSIIAVISAPPVTTHSFTVTTDDLTYTTQSVKNYLFTANSSVCRVNSVVEAFVQDSIQANASATETLTNKTISGASNSITNVSLTTAVTGTLPVANGGTGAVTHTSGNFLQGNGTGAVTATKAVPTGAVVGTTDTQTLTNKTISATNNTLTIGLTNLSDATITAPATGQYLQYNGTQWVNASRARIYGYMDFNAVVSGTGTQNVYHWVQGTITTAGIANQFTLGANNTFTYTGTATKTFSVRFSGAPLAGSNDRTIYLIWIKNPAVLITPATVPPAMPTGYIAGSRSTSTLRTAINDTDGIDGMFTVSLATNDTLRAYVANVENNDTITVSDWRIAIEEII